MPETFIPWLLSTVICIGIGAVVFYRKGPGLAVGCGLALACFVPTWAAFWINGAPLDVRLATAIVLMSAYGFHPQGQTRSAINLLDIAVCAMFIWHVVAECIINGFQPLIPLHAYIEWALPYVCGRFALMHVGNSSRLAPWFTVIAILIAALAILESATRVNPWEFLFGPVDQVIPRGSGERYGLFYRAMGPTRHPILLGCVLVLLVPWAVSLVSTEGERWRRMLGGTGIAFIVLGVFAAVSRGPLLALVIATAIALSFYYMWVRRILAVSVIVGTLITIACWNPILEFLDRIENEKSSATVIELDGEYQRRTSTRARILIVEIYGPLVLRGGLVGYGTEAIQSTPPNIPGLPRAVHINAKGLAVDNSYLLIGLRFGIVGMSLFTLMLLLAIGQVFYLAHKQSLVTYPNGPAFLVAMGSILVGVGFEMLTVLPAYDFYFWVLFSCGIVSGMTALDTKLRRGEVTLDGIGFAEPRRSRR